MNTLLRGITAEVDKIHMAHGKAEELTGNRRYRREVGWRDHDRLILEIEVSYFDYTNKKWAVKWRDASPADLPGQEVVHVDG